MSNSHHAMVLRGVKYAKCVPCPCCVCVGSRFRVACFRDVSRQWYVVGVVFGCAPAVVVTGACDGTTLIGRNVVRSVCVVLSRRYRFCRLGWLPICAVL